MFSNNYRTVLQNAVDTSKSEFIANYDSSSITDDVNNFIKNGAPLIKCFPNSNAVNYLMKNGIFVKDKYKQLNDSETTMIRPLHCEDIHSSLTNSIININNAGNFKECIKTLHGISNSLSQKMYGALLICDKIILNPFHVMTAILLADEEKYKDLHNNSYRIAIYGYEDAEQFKRLHELYKSDCADIKTIETSIDKLIQISAHQAFTQIKFENSVPSNSDNVSIAYRVSKLPNEDKDYEFYVSAHQMLTKGIVLPYYGASLIKMNGNTSGIQITPMVSCNISSPRTFNTNTIDNNPSWTSVCTGSIPSNTIRGVRTLNHANLLSPFTSNIIYPGSLVYAQVSIIKSLKIYKSAGFISGDINESYYSKPETPSHTKSTPETVEHEDNPF